MSGLSDLFPIAKEIARRLADMRNRLLPWVYWPCAAFCGLLLIIGNPPVGVLAVTMPALLYWRTRKIGLDQVPRLIYYAPFVPIFFIAFFAAQYLHEDPYGNTTITPWIIIAAVVFIISTYGFATMLARAHENYLEKEQPTDYTEMEAALAKYRILQFKLIVATTVLFATQSPILLLCLIALVKRGRVTAIVAGIAAGAAVVLSFNGHWIINWFQIYAGYAAASLWVKAAFDPTWPTTARFAARLASGAGRAYWRLMFGSPGR